MGAWEDAEKEVGNEGRVDGMTREGEIGEGMEGEEVTWTDALTVQAHRPRAAKVNESTRPLTFPLLRLPSSCLLEQR